MQRSWKRLFLLTTCYTLGLMTSVRAQVSPDGTLSTTVVASPNNLNFTINNGDRVGGNLFHSFREFSVPNGGSAVFQNAADVQNIISRVTGGSLSQINGLIQAQGSANLFLLNPAGISFGQNARLSIGGSFFATTADSFLFDNGFEFSATNPQAPPLLTVNIPIGLRFRNNPGSIQVQRNGQGLRIESDLIDTTDALRVEPNQTLALVGGDINLEGATLKTAGGRIELGSVAGEGLVSLTPTNNGFSLGYGGVQNFGNIQLAQQTAVDASGEGGGDIQVIGKRVTLTDGSQIEASTLGSQPGGSLVVNAQELVELSGTFSNSIGQFASGLFTAVYPGATGSGGNLEIKTGTLSLTNGAQITSSSSGEGNAGNVNIQARNTGSLSNGSAIDSSTSGRGNGGDIAINVGSLSLTNNSVISSSTFGEGNAGNINIQARDLVEVLGTEEPGRSSDIRANIEQGATGNGGDLTIDTKKLVIRSSQVSSTTFGQGNAGNLTVRATESVEVSGKVFGSPSASGQPTRNPAGLFAQVNITGEGNGGNLTIDTPRLSVGDGARVQVATFGQGNAGNLLIRASDIDVYETANANFFPGGIFAGVQVDEDETVVPPRGGGGTLTIETDRLRVRDGGRVSATTQGQGNAGLLQIRAKDSVEVFGLSPNGLFISEISAGATPESTGTGGSLIINTGKLIVRDRGTVTVRSQNTQPAGNLDITARTINLENQGSLTATTNSGNGGDITLNVGDYLFLRGNSEISTSAGGNGNGGNITINTPFIVAFPQNNDIIANAVSGSGGRVTINATLFGIIPRTRADLERLGVPGLNPRNLSTSDITAFSQNSSFGDGNETIGNIQYVDTGLVKVPETVSDRTQQIAQSPCRQGFGNEFVVTGRGGLPTSPNETLSSDNVRVDLLQPVASSGNSRATIKPATTVTARRVPAQGWIFNDKGQVVLTAYDPTNTGSQRPFSTAACPGR